jgi:hypothetical protein
LVSTLAVLLQLLVSLRGTGSLHGLKYAADYSVNFQPRSLVDKAYVDSVAKKFYSLATTVADTWLTITHNLALSSRNACNVALWFNNAQALAEVETVDVNSIRIKTSTAIAGLEVFING